MEEEIKTRANGIYPMRRVMTLGQTHYLSIPLDIVRRNGIKVRDLYEFSLENGALVFRKVEE